MTTKKKIPLIEPDKKPLQPEDIADAIDRLLSEAMGYSVRIKGYRIELANNGIHIAWSRK